MIRARVNQGLLICKYMSIKNKPSSEGVMRGVDLVVKAIVEGSISALVRESLDNSLTSVVEMPLVVITVVAVNSKQIQRTFTSRRDLRNG